MLIIRETVKQLKATKIFFIIIMVLLYVYLFMFYRLFLPYNKYLHRFQNNIKVTVIFIKKYT